MGRYVVYQTSEDVVRDAGGKNIKAAQAMSMVFADLTEYQAAKLQQQGYMVVPVNNVKTNDIRTEVNPEIKPLVNPIVPIAGIALFTPSELLNYSGLDKLRSYTDPPLIGTNMVIAVIDTGIRETHEKLNGCVIYSKNFTTDTMEDGYNHGTAVAGIIHEIAPGAQLLNLKVLNRNGYGTEEEVALAIDHCLVLNHHQHEIAPSVINISLGTQDLGDENTPLRIACRAAISAGIIVTCACGNDGPEYRTIMSPACENLVIAVGSVGLNPFSVSSFSSRGPTVDGVIKPDCVAFGENIIVASSESDTALTAKSGTSFAAPFAAAVILLCQEALMRTFTYPHGIPEGLDDSTVIERFTADDLINTWGPRITIKPQGVPAEKDNDYGWGLPFGNLITQQLSSMKGLDLSTILPAMLSFMMIIPMTKMMKGTGGNSRNEHKLRRH